MPFYDTAGSVKHVIAEKLKDCRGHRRAAGRSGILWETFFRPASKTTSATSHASFLIRKFVSASGKKKGSVDYQRLIPRGANKTSIAFKVRNTPGALFKSLSVFALRDISLSKIESRPMRGRPWEYVFYVDFLRGDDEPARNALRHLGEVAEFVKVLGIYPSA